MITIKSTLVSECKTRKQVIRIKFEDTEWALLEAFHAEAELLRATRFVQEKQGGSISLNIDTKLGLTSKAKPVDTEAVSAMLHRARPFLLSKESVYFFKVLNLMKRRTKHLPAFIELFERIKNHFNLTRMRTFKAFGNFGNIPDSPKAVMDWLNAYEYHRDLEKRGKSSQNLGKFSKDQNGAPIVLFALVDMVQAVLNLSDCIENIMLSKSRHFEIECPLEFFE